MPKLIFDSASRKKKRVDPSLVNLLEDRRASASRVAARFALRQEPEPGYKSLVRDDSAKGLPSDLDRTKQVALPPGSATPGGAGRDIPRFEMNTPDSSSDIQPRTLAEPGEDRGHPVNDVYETISRRPGV